MSDARWFGSVAPSIKPCAGEIILTFVNLLHELDPDENASRVIERLETEHWLKTSLDSPMVLLHDVVQVRAATDLYRVRPAEVEFIPHAHASQRRMGRLEAVQRDTPGLAVMFQCSAEERLRRGNVPGAAEVGFYGSAVSINRSVQVHPSATDPNIGLIAAPRSTYRLFERAHRFGEFNRIADDPAENRAGCN